MTVFTDPVTALNDRGLPGFGMELQLDLGGCDPVILTSRDDLVIFMGLLVEKIDMIPYGEPSVDYFGEGKLEGYTLIQRITTSNLNLITNVNMHVEPPEAGVHLNAFSCKAFDPDVVTAFAVEFFHSDLPAKARVSDRSTPTRATGPAEPLGPAARAKDSQLDLTHRHPVTTTNRHLT